ncbi:hypothetical protein MYX84_09785, partial [Acidobacteria bacterium AH-259-O06]|nr:hypothetical protein [Acidobacteria bacterium AH-259-O06]
ERAILRTVLYSSLFDYPLTVGELQQNLLELVLDESSILKIYRSSTALQSVIEYEDGYLFPRGRSALIQTRRRREVRSQAILEANRWVLTLIGSIPYTRMVALSGSAAHLNVDHDGDIDLFLVTRANRVWSVAVTILLLTKLLGRRKMVCFNFILSDDRLQIERKDLFNANQIIHLRPLLGQELYRRFVEVNSFVADFYPNFKATRTGLECRPNWILRALKVMAECLFQLGLAQLQEFMCRTTYSWYLKRKSHSWRSPEEVLMEKDYLKLHTESHRKSVMQRFEQAFLQAMERMEGV